MPLIRDEDIDEVRQRADIVDIISAQVQLKKAGRTFKGLCPFHDEKTPSFVVNPDRQTYHCFGCGEGGNVISFVMKTENLDFPEAVKTLADRVGYTLHFVEGTPGRKADEGKQARTYAANAAALAFFSGALKKPSGKKALGYLAGRGFGPSVIDRFKLGFAPDEWEAFAKFAAAKGFKTNELMDAGLVVRSEKNPDRAYDRFRGRVIFPILDLTDKIIGFGGRIIEEGTPKYLNSPETPVFHKSRALYALNWSKDSIKKEKEAIIVEGYTDVIALMDKGVENVVATLGTALGADHLKLLARYTHRVVFVFDADEAGRKAAERGLDLMREFYLGPEFRRFAELTESRHLDMFVAALPPGSDPAEFVTEKGAEEFKALIKSAKPLVDFCLNSVFVGADTKTVAGMQKTAARAMEIIAVLPSPVAREEYLKRVADFLGLSYESLFDEFKKYSRQKEPVRGQAPAATPAKRDPARNVEREVLKLTLQYPERSGQILENLSAEHFSHPDLRSVYELIKEEYAGQGGVDAGRLVGRLSDEGDRQTVTALSTEDIKTNDIERFSADIMMRIKEFEIARRINTLKAEMQKVDSALDAARHDELFSRLLKLEAERREILAQNG
ncbi:MAG: DNA primase [Actinomycetota bacterium]